jgi:hypothetical protein
MIGFFQNGDRGSDILLRLDETQFDGNLAKEYA